MNFTQTILQIITENPQIQQREIWELAKEKTGFPVMITAIRQVVMEMEEQGIIHFSRKPRIGYLVGKAPEKPDRQKHLPKYMREERENEPLKSYPRPGVMRVRMAHSNVGMKPANVISTGIGSSFSMYYTI